MVTFLDLPREVVVLKPIRGFEKKSKSGRKQVVEPPKPAPGCSAFWRLPCLSLLSVEDHAASALARGVSKNGKNEMERTKERQMLKLRRKEREIKSRGGIKERKLKGCYGRIDRKIGCRGEYLNEFLIYLIHARSLTWETSCQVFSFA